MDRMISLAALPLWWWGHRPEEAVLALKGRKMIELLQLLVGGTAQGCVYGLIALGFVLIYKATEMVNFAQGDLMMLGAFVALTCIGTIGMNYWLGFLLAALAMGAFGYLLDAAVLRRIIGQPQFAVVILTI